MKTIINRITSNTPLFFKKVQKIGLLMIALGAYLHSPIGLPDGFQIPAIFAQIGGYFIFVGGGISVVSQLTKENE